MSLTALMDFIYGNLFWFAAAVLLAIILYTIYTSLEKG